MFPKACLLAALLRHAASMHSTDADLAELATDHQEAVVSHDGVTRLDSQQTSLANSNQYILKWVDRYGAKVAARGRWAVPLKCPEAARWLEVTEDMASDPEYKISDHCVLVTCKMNGKIDAQSTACPPDTFDYGARVHRYTYAGDFFELKVAGGRFTVEVPASGKPYGQGNVQDGVMYDSAGKGFRSPYDREFAELGALRDPRYPEDCVNFPNPFNLPLPKDTASIEACEAAATGLLNECVAKAKQVRELSALYWKCEDITGVWGTLMQKFPECHPFNSNAVCPEHLSEADKKTVAEKKTGLSGMLNWLSDQHTCEQKLKLQSESSERKCQVHSYTTFCNGRVQVCLALKAQLEAEA